MLIENAVVMAVVVVAVAVAETMGLVEAFPTMWPDIPISRD